MNALGLFSLVFIFAAAAFGFFAVLVPWERRTAIESWRVALSFRGDVLRDNLDRIIAKDQSDARMLAVLPDARALLSGALAAPQAEACRGRLLDVLRPLAEVRGTRGIALQDAAGKVVVSAGWPPPGPGARGCREEIEFARDEGGRPLLIYTSPVVARPGGETSGCAVVAVDPEGSVYALLGAQVVPGPTSEAVLVQRGGNQILFLSPLRHSRDAPLTLRLPVGEAAFAARLALEGQEDFGAFVDYRGVSVLAAVRRLKNAPWGLVVKVDENEALAQFRKDVFQSGITGSVLLLALFAGAVAFWHALGTRSEVVLSRSKALSLKLMQDVLDQSSSLVYILDTEGRLLLGNRAFQSAVGVSSEKIASQKREAFMPAQVAAEHRKNDLEVIDQRRSVAFEETNVEPDGRHVYSTVKFPLLDAQGNVYAVAGMSTDITASKRAAEDLAKSEAYFRSLIENSLDLTAVLDPDGCVRYTSPSVERILGYKPEELAGRSVFELIHGEDRKNAEARFDEVLAEETRIETIEIRFKHRNGSWRRVSVIGKSLLPETGISGLILNARDITERLQLEAQFQQAQKMEAVGRLAGGVAHDFNNLLTVIQGHGELMKESLADDPERRENLDEIVKAAERAAGLTRQLLAFSRQQVLEVRVLDLGAVMADIEKMLKRLIGEDIEVGIVKPPALGHVKADPGQIEQVVLNLAVNARDAMPGGGRLTVELAEADLDAPLAAAHDAIPAGRYVVISMSDTGSGMDAETLGHIFEPFFTTKEKGKGTGLGLATVYGIVRQTGGYVAVETAPGTGTTFRIYLPRCEERIVSGIRPSVLSRRGTETILLVEDESAVRTLVNVVLERLGYTVLAAGNAAAALDIVARDPRPIHVLLTDIVMPGMNGRELASRMAALRPSIRVVFMSGYTGEILTSLDAKAGKVFISKPFTERALSMKLREVLDAPPPETLSPAARQA